MMNSRKKKTSREENKHEKKINREEKNLKLRTYQTFLNQIDTPTTRQDGPFNTSRAIN